MYVGGDPSSWDRIGWWGRHWQPPVPKSIVQLIRAGSLDARLSALLWMTLERRASILVAARPPSAGKTTTLTALLDFLAPQEQLLHLRGWNEDFSFQGRADPHSTYLLCNEISPDLPEYLWGRDVTRMFGLLEDGYSLATTIHADTLEEVLRILTSPPLNVPPASLSRVALVLFLRVERAEGGFRRGLSAAYFIPPRSRNGRLSAIQLAARDPETWTLQHTYQGAEAHLAGWLGLPMTTFRLELSERERFLQRLAEKSSEDIGAVRQAIALYRMLRASRQVAPAA